MRIASPFSKAYVSLQTPGEIQGADLRANQDDDGMAFRQGVADDQRSGSARCTQTRTFMFDLDLHGVNVAVHAVTAFWAAAKTSRADVVPATCSVPSTPRSIHPAFTASNISSAGPVWPFGMPNCSNASPTLHAGLQRLSRRD